MLRSITGSITSPELLGDREMVGSWTAIIVPDNEPGETGEFKPRFKHCQWRAWPKWLMIVDVETTVPNLLGVLCSTDMPPRQHLETQQALFKQFALIIDFTLKFDDLKVAQTLALPFLFTLCDAWACNFVNAHI